MESYRFEPNKYFRPNQQPPSTTRTIVIHNSLLTAVYFNRPNLGFDMQWLSDRYELFLIYNKIQNFSIIMTLKIRLCGLLSSWKCVSFQKLRLGPNADCAKCSIFQIGGQASDWWELGSYGLWRRRSTRYWRNISLIRYSVQCVNPINFLIQTNEDNNSHKSSLM